MNGYLYSIIIIAIITGIIKSVTSDMRLGIKKYINFVSSLIMVTVILIPFCNITKGITDIKKSILNTSKDIFSSEHIIDSNSIIISTGKEKIAEGIKDALISRFAFDERDIYISVNTDESNISAVKIISVDIILTGKASWSNVSQVKDYTENLIGVCANVTRK